VHANVFLLSALGEAMENLARTVSVMHDGGFIHGSVTADHIYLRADKQQVVRIFLYPNVSTPGTAVQQYSSTVLASGSTHSSRLTSADAAADAIWHWQQV